MRRSFEARPVLVTMAIILLLAPPAKSGTYRPHPRYNDKHVERPGWTCDGVTGRASFRWQVDDRTQSAEFSAISWRSDFGRFSLWTELGSSKGLPSDPTPVAVEFNWSNPPESIAGLPRRRLELRQDEAGQADIPIAASDWLVSDRSRVVSLTIRWPDLAGPAAKGIASSVVVRDEAGATIDRLPLPPGVILGVKDDVSRALLEMARANADFRNAAACFYMDDLDLTIIIG
jgi:hypothetical protein